MIESTSMSPELAIILLLSLALVIRRQLRPKNYFFLSFTPRREPSHLYPIRLPRCISGKWLQGLAGQNSGLWFFVCPGSWQVLFRRFTTQDEQSGSNREEDHTCDNLRQTD
mmetsp:Transcript_1863/g.3997  ORF Transcript_1863/g.3997 Transcript_1863/m.3997 type:complete len:111 (+) Transcript_1863:1421-1753(+)